MKKIFAIVISLILVLSLMACTSGKGNESTETTTEIVSTTEAPVETEIIETVVDTEAPVESIVDTNS